MYENTRSFKYYGGNLISAVGLGKTLIALYHVLKTGLQNRDVYNQFVEFSNSCNYFYKRGKFKGESCSKNNINGNLYCNEHKKTIFTDKRDIILKNLNNFNPDDFVYRSNGIDYIRTNSSLIICPNQLCDQWIQEYYSKFKNDKRILLIVTHDQYTNLTLADILFSDIVIISYNFLLSKRYNDIHKKKLIHFVSKNFKITQESDVDKTNLLNSKEFNIFDLFHWNRVICDECHEIQNMIRSDVLQKMIKSISSTYKWNITATPFANGLNGFINLMSYNTDYLNKEFNENQNHLNLSTSDMISLGFNSDIISKCCNLFRRNTKDSIKNEYSGNILRDHIELLDFTTQERSIYDSYLQGTQTKYSEFLIKLCCHSELNNDTKDMIKNCKTFDEIQKVMLNWNKDKMDSEHLRMTNAQTDIEYFENEILKQTDMDELLEPLRLKLGNARRSYTLSKKNFEDISRTWNYLKNSVKELEITNENNIEITCPICLDDIDKDNIAITKCGHKFCWDCIYETHKVHKQSSNTSNIKCPTCNNVMSNKEIYILNNTQNIYSDNITEISSIIQTVKSTKIGTIIHFLKNNIDPDDKIILFSQWDELLHKVGDILSSYNITPIYCKGSVYQRKRAITSFCKDSTANLIMLSSRNAASGINLTIANKIILLEPIYGSQEYRHDIESQAIGRADRLGQNRPIDIYRFIIKDTIEEDIINNFVDDFKIKF